MNSIEFINMALATTLVLTNQNRVLNTSCIKPPPPPPHSNSKSCFVIILSASRADLKEMVCDIWESYNRYVKKDEQDFPRNLDELAETY